MISEFRLMSGMLVLFLDYVIVRRVFDRAVDIPANELSVVMGIKGIYGDERFRLFYCSSFGREMAAQVFGSEIRVSFQCNVRKSVTNGLCTWVLGNSGFPWISLGSLSIVLLI